MTLQPALSALAALRMVSFVVVVAAWVGAGCNFDSSANAAHGCETCAPGMCYLGYCLQPATNTGAPGSGGVGVDGAGGAGGAGIVAGQGDGTAGTVVGTSGTGVSGRGAGGTPGSGGAPGSCVAADETCNASDDDCDGRVDEDVMLGSCAVPGSGACGGVLKCEGGMPVCHSSDQPAAEVCNGLDDDCDGKVDEQSDQSCYSDNTAGCTKQTDGSFACLGLCKAGTRECKAGKLAACVAFVVPIEEVCGVADAQDDDCDGKVDDNCPCQGDETQSCYTGPAFTRGVGTCRAGTQQCSHGAFGPCEGSITPVDETCDNQGADDDCNRFRDDVFLVGFACSVSENKGVCADGYIACGRGSLVCVTPDAAPAETICDGLDENCNGQTDEAFDFDNDEANCGGCAIKCGVGQLCCMGQCFGTNTDAHCGSCDGCSAGNGCCNGACLPNGPGTCSACTACDGTLSCCGGTCVDTMANDHCGNCDSAVACSDGCTCMAGQCQDSQGMACPPAS